MKIKFKKWMFNYCCLCVLVLFSNAVFSQNENVYTIEKTLSKKSIKILNINPYDVRTKILPSPNNEVKVIITYEAIANNASELVKFKSFLESEIVKVKDDMISIGNHRSKKATYVNIPNKEKVKLVFDNGRVKLQTLDWKLMEIYVPDNMDIDLHAYFSKVYIDYDLKEKLEINAFESQLKATLFKGELNLIDGQFSKFYFGSLKKASVNINDSDFTADKVDEIILDSKFSEIELGSCNELVYSGFEDKLTIEYVELVQIKSNFTDIDIQNVDKISGKLLEGSLLMGNCNDAVLYGQHSEIKAQNITLLKLKDCVEMEIKLHEVNELYSLYGELNEYKIDYLKTFFSTYQSSQEEIRIFKTSKEFGGIVLNGKFNEATLILDQDCSYTLNVDVQFSDIQLEQSIYKVELYDKEYSNEKMIYQYGNSPKKSKINIKGYEIEVELNHNSQNLDHIH